MAKKQTPLELVVSQPDSIAKIFLKKKYIENKQLCLRRLNGEWMIWDNFYRSCQEELFRGKLRTWLLKQTLYKKNKYGDLVEADCSIRIVNEIIDGIISRVIISTEETGFFWIDSDMVIAPPESIITFQNGLLDINNRKLHESTPNWFATGVLPFSYDPKAKCPNWLGWLKDTTDGDEDWIDCLRLWFGYNLTPDTSRQKFAHFYGPPRSGKGTVTRMMAAILGKWNCASPTLTQLGKSDHAPSALLGKLAAFIPDAVMGRHIDSKVIMELLSAIIGEDSIDINRKYLPIMNSVKLNVRFTISSNEPIKWPDPTNRISSRSLVFPFNRSFAGKEDPTIERELMLELPGIANWAIEGLRRVQNGERLREPKIGRAKHELFSELDSPIKVFCSACLFETNEKTERRRIIGIPCDDVRDIWNAWSKEEGRSIKGQTRTYVRSLIMNTYPKIEIQRRGERGKQSWCYVGLMLTKKGEDLRKASRRKNRNMRNLSKSLGLS